MLYEKELEFICETLKKSRIRVHVFGWRELGIYLKNSFLDIEGASADGRSTYGIGHRTDAEERTVYKFRDSFGLRFLYFMLPGEGEKRFFVMGPYVSEVPSKRFMLEVGEENGIPPLKQHYLEEYYMNIPVIGEDGHIFIMLDTFCELIWQTPSYSIIETDSDRSESPLGSGYMRSEDISETLVTLKTMESRYDFENELIRAVSLGQIQKEKLLTDAFDSRIFEKRIPDLLRNAKNYCIIMNTLLRKAAEQGGVHPIHIDRVSSEFAMKIEKLPTASESAILMREMFRTYCRLVRKHTLKSFSLVVQKTMLMIDSDLSAELTPKLLSENLNISLGYLSSVFKKETGKTLTEYIREKRISYAMQLLASTNLQVQTVAIHCGIIDVQYFSKIFKKQTGKTPKEYRESLEKMKRI